MRDEIQNLFESARSLKDIKLQRLELSELSINGHVVWIYDLDFDSKVTSGNCPSSGPWVEEKISNVDANAIYLISDHEWNDLRLTEDEVREFLSFFDYTELDDCSSIQSEI